MGRPLSRQQLFGANAKNNIKVHFHNGTAGVQGYIVRQRGSKRFLCEDEHGVQRLCHLVDKVRADLATGEMSIAFIFDDGTKGHAVKIARHLITVMYQGAYHNMPWSFSSSTSDGYWQVDEAGTDAAMDNATDVGGEDFSTLTSYPVPGSGDYLSGATFLGSATYSLIGSAAEPSGSITDVTGYAAGLTRIKYLGNYCATATTAPASWDYGFFGTATPVTGSQVYDVYGGFGSQNDLETVVGGHNFSLEWKGWIQAPVSGNYNFSGSSDDHFAVWIGNAAKTGYNNTNAVIAGHAGMTASNTVTMDAGKWYPVRMWFSEFHGDCHAQLYAVNSANTNKLNGHDFSWKHNPAGEGW